jgi:ATP-dependent protease ClpP protease subunit
MYSPSLRNSKRLLNNTFKYTNTPPPTHSNPPAMHPPPLIPIKAGGCGGDDDSDDDPMQPFKFPKLFGNDMQEDVFTDKNHIYFKTDVTKKSIDKLAMQIDALNNKFDTIKFKQSKMGQFTPHPIYLHITTNGGDLLSGFFGYDKIKASKYPIHTIIEGSVASAGSLLSIAGNMRYMSTNSHILIHQLRTGIIGTYEELVDEKKNCNHFMNKLVNIYHQNCNGKLTKLKIKDILKKDIYWDLKRALKNGIIDAEWSDNII